MPIFGPCPLTETWGLNLAVCYVKIEKANLGVTAGQVTSKQYWNHATEGWENPPRIDSKHLRTFQRLEADPSNAEFKCQLSFFASEPVSKNNVLTLIFTTDSTNGRAVEVLYSYTRNQLRILSGIDF